MNDTREREPSQRSVALMSPANARLPEAYSAAKAAIAACARVDECKDWADKAQAVASYARQADDDTLLHHAERIKARAIRRCGELLREFDADRGGRPSKTNAGTGTGFTTRKQVADEAGLSDRQRHAALRVAAVPEPEFEAAVEADKPATVTDLAERGTKKRALSLAHLKGRSPEDFSRATKCGAAIDFLHSYVSEVGENEIPAVYRGSHDHERPKLLQKARECGAWLALLVERFEQDA